MKKYTLPREFATKWVAALRSGEYKQTTGSYYNKLTNCYCAVGLGYHVNGYSTKDLYISSPDNADKPLRDIECEIIELNDEQGYDFKYVADWIESNVEFI